MATVQFGNVSADMRLTDNDYGIPALQNFDAFSATFVPVSSQILYQDAVQVIIREYDAGGSYVTITAQGYLPSGQVNSFVVEAAGVKETVLGNFTITTAGDVYGTATEYRADFAQDNSLIIRVGGLSVYVNNMDNFALPEDDVLLSGADNISVGKGSHYLLGYAGNDVMVGGTGNDTLMGGLGNDTLNGGGAGVDTAIYSSNRAAYAISSGGNTVSGPDGTDTLTFIWRLQFSDMSLAFDFGPGWAAENTVRVIGAAFDAPAIQQHPDWVGIGLGFFDSGQSMLQVCELVVPILGLSNTAFVNKVYENVVGAAPSATERDFYVGLLQGSGGSMTQAQLLEIAANAPVNELNIDLVGLQSSGVEFV